MEQNRLVISTNWFGYQNIMFTDRKTVQKLNVQKQTPIIKKRTTSVELKTKRWNAMWWWWWLSQKSAVIVLLEYLRVLSWFSMVFFNQSHGHDETLADGIRTEQEKKKYHHIAYMCSVVHLEEINFKATPFMNVAFVMLK